MRLADLHTHTSFSDGRLSPAGLIEKAALRRLAAIAITDHDSVAGCAIGAMAAERHGIDFVSGVELSGHIDGREVHILGYGFDRGNADLRSHLREYQSARVERARAMVRRLEELNAPVAWESVTRIAGSGAIGRPHVARAIIRAGHAGTMREAFETFIGNDAPAYVPKPDVPAGRLIEIVHAAGGVAVIAHPGVVVSEADVERLAREGLDGIETVHPSHDVYVTAHWTRLARRLGLLTTGGSDYHGFGVHEDGVFGSLGIPHEKLEALRERCRRITAESSWS